jgi:hypothetical protein
MELNVYDRSMNTIGLIEKITSLIWIRRYWSIGEFKMLVPFTERHAQWLKKDNILMKRGDTEAAEIRYVNIRKNSDGLEEIEVQGRFITCWIGKRIIRNQIITTDNTQNIINRIVRENATNPSQTARKIPNVVMNADASTGSGNIVYTSEAYANAILEIETRAKQAKLGFRMITNVRTGAHAFSVYAGRNLTADQTENPPCVFSQEFDNVNTQEYTNSIESLKTTAYIGGENATPRVVREVGGSAYGLDRDEIFVNATDITKTYTDTSGNQVTQTDAQYNAALDARGASELEQHAETLNFSSTINTRANLKYKEDYDLGDRVTCVNKRWGVQINVRITEIAEVYEQNIESIEITFGESLPALLGTIRQTIKGG